MLAMFKSSGSDGKHPGTARIHHLKKKG